MRTLIILIAVLGLLLPSAYPLLLPLRPRSLSSLHAQAKASDLRPLATLLSLTPLEARQLLRHPQLSQTSLLPSLTYLLTTLEMPAEKVKAMVFRHPKVTKCKGRGADG